MMMSQEEINNLFQEILRELDSIDGVPNPLGETQDIEAASQDHLRALEEIRSRRPNQ